LPEQLVMVTLPDLRVEQLTLRASAAVAASVASSTTSAVILIELVSC
jgi:hypothetical protein